ncbi:MAG: hypothetical protein M5R36_13080 [Deltaproteobacteria bacterium]|nr:hypothetical protein [Deltaproteobacteria bacterium]
MSAPSGTVMRWAKGGSARIGDDKTTRCDFSLRLLPSQTSRMPLDDFGFRCCRDAN